MISHVTDSEEWQSVSPKVGVIWREQAAVFSGLVFLRFSQPNDVIFKVVNIYLHQPEITIVAPYLSRL